jgi:hypothetical protein
MTGTSGAMNFWRGVLWLGVVIIVSVAGSGLVLALDHPQTDAGRPELTARGDALAGPRLTAMMLALSDLADAADSLAKHGRDALGHLRGQQPDQVRSDLAAGDQVVAQLGSVVESIRSARAGVLEGTALDAIGVANQDRIAQIDAALVSEAGLPGSWAGLAAAAPPPIIVLQALAAHDALVVRATAAGRIPDWPTALQRLSEAAIQLDRVRRTSAQVSAKGLDVTTLDSWVLRLSDYDGALAKLYTLLEASKGIVTSEASVALENVRRAQAALPPDTTGLTVIVSDIGGQSITQALLDIERARRAIGVAAGR